MDAGPGPDAGGAADAGSPDAGPIGEACPPPPADLPELMIVEDGPFRRVDEFPIEGFASRPVSVYLPEGYDGVRRYPVVYFTDGQWVFSAGYRTHDAMEALAASGVIEPHIIVAIYNGGAARFEELTPDQDPEFTKAESGGGDVFAGQIVDRVKPFVDAHFATRCGREHTAIAGFSLGGLMCLHMLLRDPDVFGRGICISPSFWWHDASVLARFQAHAGPLPVRLWIDVGTHEAWTRELLAMLPPDFDFFAHLTAIRGGRDLAIERGMILGDDLGYYEGIDMFHDVADVGRRIPTVLAFALSDVSLVDRTPMGHTLHVWHDQIDAPPPAHPASGTSTVSFETRYEAPFALTWPNGLVTLSSSDEGVATIAADGTITGVAPGTTTFEGTYLGRTAGDAIEVIAAPAM